MALNPSETIDAIEISLDSDINLMLWGDSGIGKSAMTRQASDLWAEKTRKGLTYTYDTNTQIQKLAEKDDLDYKFHDLRLAYCDQADFGLPRSYAEIRVGDEIVHIPQESVSSTDKVLDYVTFYTRPMWWPRADYPGLFVLFIDELNRGEIYARNASMEITAERSLKERRAPKGTRLVAACNPSAGGFQTEDLDTAMRARWAHVEAVTNPKVFVENRQPYLDDVSQNIIFDSGSSDMTLVKKDKSIEDNWTVDDETEWRPRTWEAHARLVRYIEWRNEKEPNWVADNKKVLQTMTSGLIGKVNSSTWWNSYLSGEYVTIEKILSGKLTYKDITKFGSSNVAILAMLLKNNYNDQSLCDPVTGKIDKQRALRLIRMIKDVSNDRSEIGTIMVKDLSTKIGSPNYKVTGAVMNDSKEYNQLIKDIKRLTDPSQNSTGNL